MKKTEEKKTKLYLERQNKSGFKVGMKVKVKRKAKDFERGWNNGWESSMDELIAKTVEISSIDDELGTGIRFKNENYSYPYFVLEKVK